MNLYRPVGPNAEVLIIGLATGLATLLGGGVALRARTWIDLLIAFGAGTVLGVSLFDLLPESFSLGAGVWSALAIMTAFVGGFVAYLLLNHALPAINGRERRRGHLGAGALTLHSFTDGLGVGLAFHVSPMAGLVVGAAVLAHDLLDGANTVTLALSGGTSRAAAAAWLAADALAPLVGIVIARQIVMPKSALALLLATFAGFFLYIGASELLPQALRRRPSASTPVATICGLAFLYFVVRFSGA